MNLPRKLTTIVFAFGALSLITSTARACPFCSAVQVTFTEEIKSNDVAVIAALVERPKPTDKAADAASELELLKARFKVVDVLKGDQHTKPGQTFAALYIGEAPIGKEFLVMGIEPQKVEWGAPIELSDRAKEYLHKIMKLPAKGPERLAFFQDHLEDKDALISRDAYDEFATTPYADLKELKSKMKHDMFIKRLEDPKTDASHRRLYLTMLGVCGSKDDLPFLEKMLKSDDRTMKSGLDALIGCYLTLKGAAGLPLVEELFIKRENVEFTDQYQAIMALRFHAEEGSVIEKDKIASVLRHMLDRPKYADLVVADLARWQDWSVIDRLYELFRDADQDSLWVREPIVNYMRACPLPKAKEYLKEFDKIDPKAVKRASGFFPLGAPKTSPVGEKADPAAKRPDAAPGNEAAQGKTSDAARPRTFKTVAYGPEPAAVADKRSTTDDIEERNTEGNAQVVSTQTQPPSGDTPLSVLVAVPLAVGAGVAIVVFYVSGGTNVRASA
jgi:hypothetical protein